MTQTERIEREKELRREGYDEARRRVYHWLTHLSLDAESKRQALRYQHMAEYTGMILADYEGDAT
jgi:hypothetical protein